MCSQGGVSQKANEDLHFDDHKEKEILHKGTGLRPRLGPLEWNATFCILFTWTLIELSAC